MTDSRPAKNKRDASYSTRPMELVGEIAFALYFAWMLICFFWLFTQFLLDSGNASRDFTQLFIFVGVAVGYFALHLLGRRPSFRPFNTGNLITYALTSILLPVAALLLSFGVTLPMPVLYAVNFLAGMSSAALVTCWLDTLRRIDALSSLKFTAVSLLIGCLLFLIVTVMPLVFQPVLCIVYAIASCYLLGFVGARMKGNAYGPEVSNVKSTWPFTREVEPSLFAFNIMFALTFVYLMNYGATTLLVGLAFVLLGSGTMFALASKGVRVDITVLQRVLLCITVLACIVVPFSTPVIQILCSGLVIASWGAFLTVNYALLVDKTKTEDADIPAFRQLPIRLFIAASGFMVGWVIASLTTALAGTYSDAYMIVRLCMAFVLVMMVMLFFPVRRHHDGTSDKASEHAVVSSDLSDKELFEKRCSRIDKMYALSPRESDILRYLAHGRNAGYIQDKLTISPHTVKSHIYNIYRKLDIHSQQKLMDFVENYPLDDADLKSDD